MELATSGRVTNGAVTLDGREIALARPEQVLYPEAGTTKAEVVAYYARIAASMIPHIRNRPVTLKRFPDGVGAEPYFEKSCPRFKPSWVRTFAIWSEHRGKSVDYCVIDDLPTLVWAASLATLEIHVPLATIDDIERPTVAVVDLEPGTPATIVDCADVALAIRDRLKEFGLECLAKTTGNGGLQIVVPFNTASASFRSTKTFVRTLAEYTEAEMPQLVVTSARAEDCAGKVLIDWSRNDQHKTTIAPYSLRGCGLPIVSTPVTWREVNRAIRTRDPDDLKFSAGEVVARSRKLGDVFEPASVLRQRIAGPVAVY